MQKRGLLILILLIAPILLASFALAATCSDSDGGANYAVKGTVTAKVPYIGVISGLSGLTRTVRYTDSCQKLPATFIAITSSSQKLYLVEYSCKGDSVVKKTILCPDCKNATCPSAAAAAAAAVNYSTLTVTLKNEKGNALGIVVRTMIEGPVSLGAGRTVTLHLKSDPVNVHYSKTTDSSSTAKFTNIPPGEYFLFVSPPAGYKAWSGGNVCPFKLAANESARTDVCLEPGTGTSICYKCPSQTTCKDSDGGKDYYIKGTTYGEHQVGQGPEIKNWVDYCIDGKNLYEFSCQTLTYPDSRPLDVWSDLYACPNGCSNGACLGAPTCVIDRLKENSSEVISVGANQYKIADLIVASDYVLFNINGESTDKLAEGAAKKLSDGSTISVADILYSSREDVASYVELNICAPQNVIEIPPTPAVTHTCTDSDKGIQFFAKGNVTISYSNGTKQTFTDSCSSDGETLKEWYCKDNTALSVKWKCINLLAMRCRDGRCVR